jgi:4-amino-4-deoxy-L-arabinose transferase-like glycosyltransferase
LAFFSLQIGHLDLSAFESYYYTKRGTFLCAIRAWLALGTALTVFVAYALAVTLTHKPAWGLALALLLAVNPTFVYHSTIGLPDALAVLWVGLTLWGALKIAQNGRAWAYFLAGGGLALTLLTRLQALPLLLSPLVAHLMYTQGQEKRWQAFKRGLGWLITGFSLTTFLANPFTWLAPRQTLADLDFVRVAHFGASSSFSQRGAHILVNIELPFILLRPYLFVSGLVAGLFLLWRRPSPPTLVILLTAFALPTGLLVAENPRITYWLPSLFPLLVVIMLALADFRQTQLGRRLAWWIYAFVLLLSFAETVAALTILNRPSTREQAYQELIATLPSDSTILIGSIFTYSVPLNPNRQALARALAESPDPPAIFEFWQDNPPALPHYNLIFAVDHAQEMRDDDTWWRFVRQNNIRYVLETDFCTGETFTYQSTVSYAWPYLSPTVRPALRLVATFSPFRETDACLNPIGIRTSLDFMNLFATERLGPIIRLYEIPPA